MKRLAIGDLFCIQLRRQKEKQGIKDIKHNNNEDEERSKTLTICFANNHEYKEKSKALMICSVNNNEDKEKSKVLAMIFAIKTKTKEERLL